MNAQTYEEVLQQAEKLPPSARLLLIERLIHNLRATEAEVVDAPAWEDYAGSVPYPLCGEDAQEWVSRSRRGANQR